MEFLFTFALALVVLNSAAVAGGGISGGAYNHAVGIGPSLVHATLGGGSFSDLWIYLAGPLLGATAASAVFGLQERPEVHLHTEPSRVPEHP